MGCFSLGAFLGNKSEEGIERFSLVFTNPSRLLASIQVRQSRSFRQNHRGGFNTVHTGIQLLPTQHWKRRRDYKEKWKTQNENNSSRLQMLKENFN